MGREACKLCCELQFVISSGGSLFPVYKEHGLGHACPCRDNWPHRYHLHTLSSQCSISSRMFTNYRPVNGHHRIENRCSARRILYCDWIGGISQKYYEVKRFTKLLQSIVSTYNFQIGLGNLFLKLVAVGHVSE